MNQHRKTIFNKWLSLTNDIYDNFPNVPMLACANCYQLGIDFQFIGDSQTKIGFMVIWCPLCFHGIHLSRVDIPDQAQILPFYISIEKIPQRIPNFIPSKPN